METQGCDRVYIAFTLSSGIDQRECISWQNLFKPIKALAPMLDFDLAVINIQTMSFPCVVSWGLIIFMSKTATE